MTASRDTIALAVDADLEASGPPRRRGSVPRAYRAEVQKLAVQRKVQSVFVLCVVAPILFVAALDAQGSVPMDTLFGQWVHTSGYAVPLVILGFSGQWALPALTSIVAGDIFSAEDRHGTWKTILTRSCSRRQIFIAKALAAVTYSVLAVAVLALVSLGAGLVLVGRQPIIGLSGQLVTSGSAVTLTLASWATVLPPVLGFTALGLLLSVATRNSVVGVGGPAVIGLLMQLGSLLDGPPLIRTLLLATPFGSWHGLWASDPFYRPVTLGIAVSAAYVVACGTIAYLILRRRGASRS